MLNHVILVGRLTNDVEIKHLENGKQISCMDLAVGRAYKNENGVYDTDFIPIVLWNGIAENTSEFCKKGDVVGIKGRLQTNIYLDGDTKKKVVEVVAEKVTFLSSKKENEQEN